MEGHGVISSNTNDFPSFKIYSVLREIEVLCANTALSSGDIAVRGEKRKRKFCCHEVYVPVLFSLHHFGFVLPSIIIISNRFFFSNFLKFFLAKQV